MVSPTFQNYILKNLYIILIIGLFTVVAYAWTIAIDTYLEIVFGRAFGYNFIAALLISVLSGIFIVIIGQSISKLPAFSVDDVLISQIGG